MILSRSISPAASASKLLGRRTYRQHKPLRR